MQNHWLVDIDIQDLVALAPPLAVSEINPRFTVEDVVNFLCQGGPLPPQAMARKPGQRGALGMLIDERPPKKYWDCVKAEVFLLVCTNDKKYAKLRKQLNDSAARAQTPVVWLVASGIAATLGISAAVVAGLCAAALYGIVKVGKEAYCEVERGKRT